MRSEHARTVVVTGGSAGVGRATALAFARRGWNVALIARDEAGLEHAREETAQTGAQLLVIPADVADAGALSAAADRISRHWGAIDVWVNNAMVTMFAPVCDTSPDEFRRITDVTYLGYVHGTMAALTHMRPRNAGTIVQVGSALSYRAIPLQAAYCGAKFAIRGFTDALRSELLHDGSRIRITMVQLPAINTPQFDWARNKLGKKAQPVPPIHQPDAAAEAIFRASQTNPRELWVGFASLNAILGTMMLPGMLDRMMATKAYKGQLSSELRDPNRPDNLFEPVTELHTSRGRFDARARRFAISFNPAVARLLAIFVLVFVVALVSIVISRSLQ